MKSFFACLPAFTLACTLLSACSFQLASITPDFAGWFTKNNEVLITEVANDAQCHAPDEKPRLQLLADSRAVKAWESSRGVSLSGEGELPVGPYIVIDQGQRDTGGYGVAVSRQAALRDETLVVKVTLFDPEVEEARTPVPTSPCALVRLPPIRFDSLKLIDQNGKVRASTSGYAPS